jgi:hypothetical protein
MRQFLATIVLVLFFTTTVSAATAQKFEVKKVDFEQIRKDTQDPRSKLFYPKLLKSFMANDTSMNFEGYRNLYYGYVFQEDYNPCRVSGFSSVIEPLYYKKTYTRAECDTIEKYAELSLDDNPFDLRQMKFYIFALKEKKKNARAAIRQYRLNHLVAAILSSGNGTKENPWVVISPDHEYNIVNFLGYIATGHQDMGNNIDYITIDKGNNPKAPDGFYFDASKIMEVTNLKFPQESAEK